MTEPDAYILKTVSPYRVWIATSWENAPLTDFVKNIKRYTESACRVILLDSRNRVVRGELETPRGETIPVVIKQFRKRSHYDTARFTVIRSKALRSFLNALALQELSIGTPEPVLCAEKRDGAFLLESYYVCRYVPFDFSLNKMFEDRQDITREPVLSALAKTVRKIHEAGYIFGDLNGANILIQQRRPEPILYFIDLNRMKLRGREKITAAAKAFDLSWLGIPSEYKMFFLEAYTGKTVSPVHDAYDFALKYRRRVDALKKVRKLWRK